MKYSFLSLDLVWHSASENRPLLLFVPLASSPPGPLGANLDRLEGEARDLEDVEEHAAHVVRV
jgi:hypothetical protein